jgi:hypothetical protein
VFVWDCDERPLPTNLFLREVLLKNRIAILRNAVKLQWTTAEEEEPKETAELYDNGEKDRGESARWR